MRRALAYASTFGALVVGHAEDPELVLGAAMNEGEFATRLGIPAAPPVAETLVVERDLRLVELTGARFHFGQISTRSALEAIVDAKARGLPVTCAVSAHHLALNELDVGAYLTFRKVKPPLRSEADRVAMVEGVSSGQIDVIVSSHDPQAADTKRQTFAQAAFGAVGLETLLPGALQLYHNEDAGLLDVLERLTAAPARILGLEGGRLESGAPADLVLFDPDESFRVDPALLHSRARNTPFEGRTFEGRVHQTWVGGKCVFDRALKNPFDV
jgi:dihydroorotase